MQQQHLHDPAMNHRQMMRATHQTPDLDALNTGASKLIPRMAGSVQIRVAIALEALDVRKR